MSRSQTRGTRWPFVLLILLILGVGGLVVADRIAERYAAQRVHDQVLAELASHDISTGQTDVSIDGFPFLTQVAAGRYDKITINMTDVEANGAKLPRLLVVARGVLADPVQVANGQAQVTAETVTGDGIIDWTSLGTLVDSADLNVAGARFTNVVFTPAGDQVHATGTVNVLNQQIPVTATAHVTLAGNAVRVQLSEAKPSGPDVPAAIQNAIDSFFRGFSFAMAIPPLPFGLKIDQMHAEADGVSITATAKNVPLGR